MVAFGLRAQELDDNQVKRLYLSATGGVGLMGPQSNMEDQMRASGLGDTQSGGWFSSGNTAHPNSSKIPTLHLTGNYWLKGRQGTSLEIGLVDYIEVNGYDNIGIGNYISLRSAIWSASLNYMLGSKNRNGYLSVGPALLLHHVKDDASSNSTDAQTKWLAGFNASYTLHLIDKSSWFMAFKVNGRIAPKSETGPFVAEHQLGIGLPEPENYRSEFRQTKVQISGFNVGLTAGLKLGKGA
ncbi:hypothetical protein [Pontibacter ramchanderi]|uniref:Outer membrane protein with beta-barrel domain n=1 Tax=Pontibacter ramchanderi TaxID=1179743 RepID=A0A2N3V0S0_9BACT|nr:hypothetical protein [Pontibacter ramchanderi]PKV75205.1 hypothetical protein BD749_0143 [Pontibacter ramchanderi]